MDNAMTITVYWDTDTQENLTLYMDFRGAWDWEEYDRAVDDATQLMTSLTHRVDVICNLLGGEPVPLDYVYSHLRRMSELMAENAGLVVMISRDTTFKALVYVFCKTSTSFADKIRVVDTLQKAYSLLTERHSDRHDGQPERL
jgi:hypothetical protein